MSRVCPPEANTERKGKSGLTCMGYVDCAGSVDRLCHECDRLMFVSRAATRRGVSA